MVDLLHGKAEIPVRPGHAGGRYDADLSRWILGYIIGREWEPYAVTAFDSLNRRPRPFRGKYLSTLPRAGASDIWMAEQCDYLLDYEVGKYNTIRPIAYTNWPTLDPLTHITEATGNGGDRVAQAGGPAAAARSGRVRERRDRTRRHAGAGDGDQPGRLVRQLSRLSLLSRFPALRPDLRQGPLQRGPIELLRLPAGPEEASRRHPAADLRIRRALQPGHGPPPAPGLESRRPRRSGDGRDRRPPDPRDQGIRRGRRDDLRLDRRVVQEELDRDRLRGPAGEHPPVAQR